MTILQISLFYITVFLISFIGVEYYRRWSLKREFFDVPNERSSHTSPTPRGGGLIIVGVSLTAYIFLSVFVTKNFQWSYFVGAILIALISWLDDIYTISFGWRFLIHAISALLVIFNLGFPGEIYLPFFHTINIGVTGAVLTFFWIVWLTNAYNFMDGIDGIAGMQAVTAGIGWFLIGNLLELPVINFYGGVLAVSSFGFLIKNWQPAKIFMGDVGSAFLGYSFAVLPLLAKNDSGLENTNQPILFTIGILLVWLFVFDTLWTFAGRLLRKEKVWQAHRGHLYQKMVINGLSHQYVTIMYGLMSFVISFAAILWMIENHVWEIWLILSVFVLSAGLLIWTFLLKIKQPA